MPHSSITSFSKPDEENGCRLFRQQKGCATFECGNILLPISVFSCKSDFNMTDNVDDTEMFISIAHPLQCDKYLMIDRRISQSSQRLREGPLWCLRHMLKEQ